MSDELPTFVSHLEGSAPAAPAQGEAFRGNGTPDNCQMTIW